MSVTFSPFASPFTSSVLFFRISPAFAFIRRIHSLICLMSRVIPKLMAYLPKKQSKGVLVSSPTCDMVFTTNSSYLRFIIYSLIWSVPKKHFIITPLKILADTFNTSNLNLLYSIWLLESNTSKHLSQISLILGMFSLTRSKLNTFEMIFRLFFHYSPQLKTIPLPAIAIIPSMIISNLGQILQSVEQNSFIKSGLTKTKQILSMTQPIATSI